VRVEISKRATCPPSGGTGETVARPPSQQRHRLPVARSAPTQRHRLPVARPAHTATPHGFEIDLAKNQIYFITI